MDQPTQEQPKSGLSKKTLAIIFGLLLIIGGSVTAYILLDQTTKEKYFSAEKETLDFLGEQFEEKFKLESAWSEKTSEQASKSEHRMNVRLGEADLGGGHVGGFNTLDLLSNATLLFDIQRDPNEKAVALHLGVDFANMDLGNIGATVSEHDLYVELPFTEDILHIQDSEINELLYEIDPYTFSEPDPIDFDSLFDVFSNDLFADDDMEYLQEEYIEYMYDELPETAFEEENDSIEVHGKKIKANKITFHLTEDELKTLLEDVLRKLTNDDRVKEMVTDVLESELSITDSMSPGDQELMDEILQDFETTLKQIRLSIPAIEIPDGFTSTIWVDKKKVVQRDISFQARADEHTEFSLAIAGSHLLEDEQQQFDIDFTVDNGYEENVLNVSGELNWKDKKGEDHITIQSGPIELTYEANEAVVDKATKEFDRSLHFTDGSENFGLNWSGDATYKKEQMESSHTFSFMDDGIQDHVQILLDKKGSLIKEVPVPSSDNIVSIGEMEMFEIDMYMEKLANEFEQWIQQISGGFLGF
ncbi:MAG TPA: DUF6583 family protein [Bacillota bacterium]|nr:DUF6583 family protein [Bacillota bacterium]